MLEKRTKEFNFLVSLVIFICTLCSVSASVGDRTYIFSKCVSKCESQNCTDIENYSLTQPTHMRLLRWSCTDDCRYNCMWLTVDAFQRDGSKVPQFYGKWPFVRYAGIQEPASMIFSLLNAASHLAILLYRAKVPAHTPLFRVWHGMALVGIVTWLCATIFHTRDTPLTEKLDYFSAFGLILFNVFTLICRIIGTSQKLILGCCACILMGLYAYHIHFLAFVHFDYGYNMMVNIAVGAVNGIGWIIWSIYQYKTRPYTWKCVVSIIGLNALLLLELGDFPPLLWTVDAHALWHAGTVPINLLWYSFIIDDALHQTPTVTKAGLKKMA